MAAFDPITTRLLRVCLWGLAILFVLGVLASAAPALGAALVLLGLGYLVARVLGLARQTKPSQASPRPTIRQRIATIEPEVESVSPWSQGNRHAPASDDDLDLFPGSRRG